jgi:hypothetical protein
MRFPFPRVFIAIAAVVMALWISRAPAAAEVEYCPAIVSLTPTADAQTFGVRLEGGSARSVLGIVAVHTDKGWYRTPVPEMKLHEVEQTWRDASAEFKRNAWESDPIFLHFPKPVSLGAAFMLSAQTHGETVFGWDKRGPISCAAPPDRFDAKPTPTPDPSLGKLELVSPRHDRDVVPAGAPIAQAEAISIDYGTCQTPFASSKTSTLVSPQFPEQERNDEFSRADVIVTVAVGAAGEIDDAWVFAPSFSPYIDNAALKAAKESRYTAARSFCQDVPSLFQFFTTFSK